jgi:hypothetical protein
VVSREAVILAGDYKLSDIPDDEEDLRRFTRELMLRDPNLFQIPAVRKVAGYTEEILPAATVVTPAPGTPGAGPPPPPAPPTGISPTAGAPLPAETEAQNAPGGPPAVPSGAPPTAIAAGLGDPDAQAVNNATVLAVANAAVLRALEVAGKRLLSRQHRGNFPDVPAHDLHTRIRINGREHAEQLMTGAWDHLSALSENLNVDIGGLQDTLNEYCYALMAQEQSHRSGMLVQVLRNKGHVRDVT